ncbi:MAG: DNA polymerase III subunit delta [Gammaproteobacteria bacterium]|nr:DNA polymerase III subunit delta [Gammaproteobacteria bacterium]MCW9088909.1 DNA polymerase III subunit delta [Gammaproteobacteria bacterium]
MKLYYDKLSSHLQQGLQPLYLLSGDEPLQLMEAGDAIRRRARELGFGEREVLQVEPGFDWGSLLAATDTLSLFAEQRLIELRMPSGKPGKEGSKALSDYAANPPPDTLLLITSGKLDRSAQNSKWYKALERVGVTLALWPIEPQALPGWVTQRMRARGMQPTAEATQLLAERVEGNMLAAAQEVEKLLLLYGETAIDAGQVEEGVADSARYDIFELVDTALLGDVPRTSRVIQGLRGEGVEPILLLWALLRELRALVRMADALERGAGIEPLLEEHRVWNKRKGPVRAGLQRHNLRRWQLLLRRAGRIDRMIKGIEPGNPWDELLQLALLMAGVRTV